VAFGAVYLSAFVGKPGDVDAQEVRLILKPVALSALSSALL
jgi:hypothetical protein